VEVVLNKNGMPGNADRRHFAYSARGRDFVNGQAVGRSVSGAEDVDLRWRQSMNGMDGNEDDHDFSDDDFDTLPINALHELERIAISSTLPLQAQSSLHTDSKQQNLAGNTRQSAPYTEPQVQGHSQSQNWQPQSRRPRQHGRYTDYNDDPFEGENVSTPAEEKESFILRTIPMKVTQREQRRQERFSEPRVGMDRGASQVIRQPARQNFQPHDSGYLEESNGGDAQDLLILDQQQAPNNGATRSLQEEALQAQIEYLLRERDELTAKLHISNTTVLTQKGEIAIIRANQSKESKTFDRQLAALKMAAEEEAAKHQTRLESMLAKSKELATENQFLKHDLKEEESRNMILQRTLKDKPPGEKGDRPASTPQRVTADSLRDGFDDGELMIISPSKSGRRSKGGTPTAGAKRKRKIDVQSPIPSLALRQSAAPVSSPTKEAQSPPIPERVVPTIRRDRSAGKNLQFVQRIFNHRIAGGNERILEALMKYAFPSDPSKTFTSIVLEAIARLSGKGLPADLLQVFIELWAKSLQEKYYKCISSLADVVNFIVDLEISVINVTTIQSLLPVLQDSGEINGTPRFKNNAPGKSKETPQSELNNEVDGTACLETLYNIACICLDDDRIDLFWRSMNMDFVLLMLNISQPTTDITLMLKLLSTSILPQTFGMISASAEEQAQMEIWILDRICALFWDRPRVDEGVSSPTKSEICMLRLEAMNLLNNLTLASAPHPHNRQTHHGSHLVIRHRSAIARLIRCIYNETNAMYHNEPSRALHAELVNQGIRLVYYLLQNHSETIDMQEKLLAINGCVHKHRVVLTRLAFGEGLLLDAGITQQTVDMATDMLEEAVTPEEAESLVEAFPGYKGRRTRA
jgi:Protein of unknown function (DUF3636)